jgi:hypothetical protein
MKICENNISNESNNVNNEMAANSHRKRQLKAASIMVASSQQWPKKIININVYQWRNV